MKNNVGTFLAVLFFCTSCTLVAGNTFGRRRPAEEKHEKIARAYRAILHGEVRKLEGLLREGMITVDEIHNGCGSTALEGAIHGRQPDVVRCLLEHGASVIAENDRGQNSVVVSLELIDGTQCGPIEVLHELLRYHPAIGRLFNEKWVQWSVDRRSPKAGILFNAIDHVENNRQNGTVAHMLLVDQLPAPVITMVQSYLSYRQETEGEKAQTVGLLARARAH